MTETVAAYDLTPPTPVPSAGVARAPVPQMSMAGPEALAAAGQENRQLAQETDRYGLHLDTLQAQDALNRLRTKREDLTFGPQGFTQIKGGDVLKKDADGVAMLDSYRERFKAVADDISQGLSPQARQMFDPHAGVEQRGFMTAVGTHSVTQTEHFNTQVLKDGLAQDQAEASRNFADPAALEQIAARSGSRARKYAESQGLPGEAAELAAQSNIISIGVKSLLATGAQRQALAYFDANHDKLDAQDRVQIGNAIKSVADNVTAENRAAEAVLKAGGTPGPTDDTSSPQYLKAAATLPGKGQYGNVTHWGGYIERASQMTGIRPSLIAGFISAESAGNANAVSPAGAAGPAQFMPATARSEGVANVRDPEEAIPKGAGYLKKQLVRFGGDETAALAAYNWGPENVAKWKAAGGDFSKLPAETRAYIADVRAKDKVWGGQAAPASGEPVAGQEFQGAAFLPPRTPSAAGKKTIQGIYSQASLDVQNDPSLSTTEKARTLAILSREGSALSALQTAQVATLDDQVAASTAAVLLNPKNIVPGMFNDIADRYASLGQAEKAMNYRTLASMEGVLKDGLSSAPDAQLEILKSLTHGLPKRLIEAYMAGTSKQRGEDARLGTEAFSQIHKSIEENNLAPSALTDAAKTAINHFVAAGQPEKARQVADYMDSAHGAHRATTGGSTADADQAIANLTAQASQGHATVQQLQQLSLATSMFNHQAGLLKQDPFKNGAAIYSDKVGQVPPLNFANPEDEALVVRAGQARTIAALTGNPAVIPFTNEEVAQLRTTWEGAPPAQQQQMVASLGKQMSVYPDMIPHVAASIAGKGVSDPVSQSLAAALSFHGEGDPDKAKVGNSILRGAALRKAGDPGIRKVATDSDTWLSNWQAQTSTALSYLSPEARSMLHSAIVSYAVNEMDRAGRGGEKLTTDDMNKAIRDVAGTIVNFRGQPIITPTLDMTNYQMEAVLGRLQASDIPPNLRTREGDPITVDDIKNKAILGTVGTGAYKVMFPDPRNRGIPGEVEDPRHQTDPKNYPPAFLIDLRPLMARGQQVIGEANRPDYVTGVPSLAPKRGGP